MDKPIILIEGKYAAADLERMRNSGRVWETADIFERQLGELFEIRNPALKNSPNLAAAKASSVEKEKLREGAASGNWIYLPWSGELIHAVTEGEYYELRTNRNRNLVTREEQQKLRDFPVAIAGLSVGSNIATTLAYLGIARSMKLAEFDTLETTNLNRIRAAMGDIGKPKLEILARNLYKIDPYADLKFYPEGLNEENIADFVNDDSPPRLIFEIIDNFVMKVRLRKAARIARVPVITLANVGDRILVDIERYDLDENTPLFNGRVGDLPEEIIMSPDTSDEIKNKYAVNLVKPENIPARALASVEEISKTLTGRPQLASTVTVNGGFCAYFAKCIALGRPLKSQSTLFNLDRVFLGLDDVR